MAESFGPARAGLIGRVRAAASHLWLRAWYTTYSRNYFKPVGRALRMLCTGQFKLFLQKLRRREAGRALSAYNRPDTVVRTGPPLHLAGSIHGPGGYDHVVLKALIGLFDAGVHVYRDAR